VSRSIWRTLGIERTADTTLIRRAYARKLKVTNPEDDEAGFVRLREAYEAALQHAQWSTKYADFEDADDDEEDASAEAYDPDGPDIAQAVQIQSFAFTEAEFAPRAPEPAADPAPAAPKPRGPWDPDPSAPPREEVLFKALSDLLTGPQEPAPAALVLALNDLLASEALQSFVVHDRMEARLAALIWRNAPRSDVLIKGVALHFGWDSETMRRTPNSLIDRILGRRDDLRFLHRIRTDFAHEHLGALRALTAKPAWRTWIPALLTDRAQKVAAFLTVIRLERPGLMANLDPEAVEWWEAWLEKPVAPPWAILSLLFLTLVMAFAPAPPLTLIPDSAPGAPLWRLLGALGLGGAAGAALHYGLLVPRHEWREDHRWSARRWLKYGWAGLALLSPPLAGALPASPWSAAFMGLLAGGVAIWSFVTGEPEGYAAKPAWPLRAFANVFYPLLFLAMLGSVLPPALQPQLWVATLGTALAWSFGGGTLIEAWRDEFPRERRLVAIGLVGGLIALAAAGLVFGAKSPAAHVVAGLTLAAAFAAKPAGAFVFNRALKIRRYGMWFSFALFSAWGGPFLGGGLWLLTGAAFSLLAPLIPERPRKPRRSALDLQA
jgi:hypothetical protein